jgi:hypothetical protein
MPPGLSSSRSDREMLHARSAHERQQQIGYPQDVRKCRISLAPMRMRSPSRQTNHHRLSDLGLLSRTTVFLAKVDPFLPWE